MGVALLDTSEKKHPAFIGVGCRNDRLTDGIYIAHQDSLLFGARNRCVEQGPVKDDGPAGNQDYHSFILGALGLYEL